MEIEFKPTEKQKAALNYLWDDHTEELFFGGGAGGGKSLLGCFWIVSSCLQYPGIRCLIGRARLKTLKETTLKTLFDVMGKGPLGIFKLEKDRHYKYNAQEGTIRFWNGSEIVLKDLFLYPTDPEFDELGSSEYTFAFLDEISQIVFKAKDIVMTRLRYKTDQFGIIGKALFASNPAKNWGYSEFYKPWKEKKLPRHRKFIVSLVGDNPHIPKSYIQNLKRREKATKERLLYGNWEYDDDPSVLMSFEKITDIFTNTFVGKEEENPEKYIVADLAMQGRDRFIVSYWEGLRGEFIVIKAKSEGREIEETLKKEAEKRGVPRSNIIYDSGGMGSYLESYLKGAYAFNSGSSPTNKEFKNLRAECFFKLAELVNKNKIYIKADEKIKQELIEEFEQVKRDKLEDPEMKKQIIKKEQMKEMLGRSPDLADTVMMRMVREVEPIIKPRLTFG